MNDIITTYAARRKKKIFYCMISLLILLLAMYIKYLNHQELIFNIKKFHIVILLQLLVLVPILWAIKYSKCPACNKNAGSGWNVKRCDYCGEKLK